MSDTGRPVPDAPEGSGRPPGGTGHVFTLYVARQVPGPQPDGRAAGEPAPLGFLRGDQEGPSGP